MSVEKGEVAAGIIVPAEAGGVLALWSPVVVTGRATDGLPIVNTTTTIANPDVYGVVVDRDGQHSFLQSVVDRSLC